MSQLLNKEKYNSKAGKKMRKSSSKAKNKKKSAVRNNFVGVN